MAAIDELIEQIDNPTLRERISTEVQRMVKQKKFGLAVKKLTARFVKFRQTRPRSSVAGYFYAYFGLCLI